MSRQLMFYGMVLVLTSGVLSACGLKKQVTEMRDATASMSKASQQLDETSRGIGDRTAQIAEVYDALKHGDPPTARRAALQALLQAKEGPRKVSEAGQYLTAFEFQIWSGRDSAVDEERLELAADAARIFFDDVQDFVVGEELLPRPFARATSGEADPGNRTHCLNAIAVSLHLLNPKQGTLLKSRKGLRSLSMLTMIEEALAARDAIDKGAKRSEDYPRYVKEILLNEDLAVHLLQVRYNALGSMALEKTPHLKTSVWQSLPAESRSLETDLSSYNLVELRELTRRLKMAMETYEFLLSIDQKPLLDSLLKQMYEKLIIKTTAERMETSAVGSDKLLAEDEFSSLIGTFRTSSENAQAVVSPPPPDPSTLPPVEGQWPGNPSGIPSEGDVGGTVPGVGGEGAVSETDGTETKDEAVTRGSSDIPETPSTQPTPTYPQSPYPQVPPQTSPQIPSQTPSGSGDSTGTFPEYPGGTPSGTYPQKPGGWPPDRPIDRPTGKPNKPSDHPAPWPGNTSPSPTDPGSYPNPYPSYPQPNPYPQKPPPGSGAPTGPQKPSWPMPTPTPVCEPPHGKPHGRHGSDEQQDRDDHIDDQGEHQDEEQFERQPQSS